MKTIATCSTWRWNAAFETSASRCRLWFSHFHLRHDLRQTVDRSILCVQSALTSYMDSRLYAPRSLRARDCNGDFTPRSFLGVKKRKDFGCSAFSECHDLPRERVASVTDNTLTVDRIHRRSTFQNNATAFESTARLCFRVLNWTSSAFIEPELRRHASHHRLK